MNQIEYDQKIYLLAKQYLTEMNIAGVTPLLIEEYLEVQASNRHPASMSEIYKRMLMSAQNANMKAGVIGGSIGGVENLGPILGEFNVFEVLNRFSNWEELLNEIEAKLKPVGQIRRTSRSIWPHYCQTILSSAAFLAQFSGPKGFYEWVNLFDTNEAVRPALPLLIDKEVSGIGFALACDFLKELGYSNFAKPDVHLRDIFTSLNLCNARADDYQIFKAIIRLAKNANVTPYNADKIFWLIGSGYFYNDKHIGNEGRIPSQKEKFIKFAKNQLGLS